MGYGGQTQRLWVEVIVCTAFYRVPDDQPTLLTDHCICHAPWRHRLIKVYNVTWSLNTWSLCQL